MDVKLVNKGDTGELVFIGRLDSASAPDVEKICKSVVERFDTLIFNFAELEYTSSAGLRIILKINMDMNKKGGSLYIKSANKVVMEVLEMTGMASYLTFI